jgi:hypothetical protein
MLRAQEQRASVRRQTLFASPNGRTPLRCWLIDGTAEGFASLADLSGSGARGRGGVMGLAFDAVRTTPTLDQIIDGALRAT